MFNRIGEEFVFMGHGDDGAGEFSGGIVGEFFAKERDAPFVGKGLRKHFGKGAFPEAIGPVIPMI
jgi:hypothetical protein